jgi:dCMP deaminase
MRILTRKWLERFAVQADIHATYSKDPNTQVGALILFDDGRFFGGYNGLPPGVRDLPERYSRENREKDLWVCHAEENCITHAAAEGIKLRGTSMLVTHHPCPRCAGMIISAGIKKIFVCDGISSLGERDIHASRQKFRESDVEFEYVGYLPGELPPPFGKAQSTERS